jgi:hypothetical protein
MPVLNNVMVFYLLNWHMEFSALQNKLNYFYLTVNSDLKNESLTSHSTDILPLCRRMC